MLTLILVSLAVMLTSALASGVEAALFTVPYARVRTLIASKRQGARRLLRVKDDMVHAIGTLVIINNIANIVGSALVGAIASDVFSSAAIGAFFAVFTLAIIIFSELIPKTFGEAHADRVALLAAPPLLVLMGVFRPVLWMISRIVALIRLKPPARDRVSEDEIRTMALMGYEAGSIEKDESRMIQRVFKLNDIAADDMMTPLAHVESLPADHKLGDLRDRILRTRHSRLPVLAEDGETVLGVVMLRDLLAAMAGDRFETTPAEYAQEAVIVPSDVSADDLLPLFQQREQHLAVVVDAGERMIGVVSLEDVIEELVGEITDEKDVRPETIKRLSKTEILVDEGTSISKINHFFNTEIGWHGTIGDAVVEKFGRKPKTGESVVDGALTFTVAGVTRTRPKLIKISKQG